MISNLFFTRGDYALFESALAGNPEYDGERERVHNKLVSLHKSLYPEVRKRKWELHPHWMTQWLVSASRISPATSRIDFMTLRYSKDEATIKMMKQELFEDFGHFYANAMLAARVDKEGFAVELLINEKAWVDGQNLKARLNDSAPQRTNFCKLLAELGGEHTLCLAKFLREDGRPLGYRDVLRARASRLVNTGVLHATMDKYKPGGHDLRLGIQYSPNDPRLQEKTIVKEILARFEQLYPIYQFLSWSPKNNYRDRNHEHQKPTRRTREASH